VDYLWGNLVVRVITRSQASSSLPGSNKGDELAFLNTRSKLLSNARSAPVTLSEEDFFSNCEIRSRQSLRTSESV
jgi:hypothetical protein